MVNTMKSSEEIARDHLFDGMEEVDHFDKHEWTPPEWLLKAMQSHTDATLDTLKERVEEYEKESELLGAVWKDEFNRGFNDACKKILQLIDEVRNE